MPGAGTGCFRSLRPHSFCVIIWIEELRDRRGNATLLMVLTTFLSLPSSDKVQHTNFSYLH